MGSSGFLLLGIVALWAFGAVPHWVQRREQLAAAWRAEASDDELRLLERRELSRTSSAPVSSAGRLLAAPRVVVAAAPAPHAAAGPAPTGKGSRPAAQPVAAPARRSAPRRGPSALPAVAALLTTGLVAAAPAVLAVLGIVPLSAAPVGLVALVVAVLALRRRAAVKERSARATALRASQARTRAAQVRATHRRADETRAAVVARAAAASAAAAERTFAVERDRELAVARAREVQRGARTAAAAPRRRAVGE